MDLQTERKKLLHDLYYQQTNSPATWNEGKDEFKDYIEWLEKNLYSFIMTDCDEIKIKAIQLDEKDFAEWMFKNQKENNERKEK